MNFRDDERHQHDDRQEHHQQAESSTNPAGPEFGGYGGREKRPHAATEPDQHDRNPQIGRPMTQGDHHSADAGRHRQARERQPVAEAI